MIAIVGAFDYPHSTAVYLERVRAAQRAHCGARRAERARRTRDPIHAARAKVAGCARARAGRED
jgi:hypothetical protein